MHIDKLHPELRKTYARIPSVPFHNSVFYFILNGLQKLQSSKIRPFSGVSIEDTRLNQSAVRIYRPEANATGAGLLWIHGGGYIMGNTAINDRECTSLARDVGLVVVSVDYRLAPRHPFPAALDDCYDAWSYMLSNVAQWGLDSRRIAVMGQSAGGGLAAAVVQRIADAGGVQPAAQLLLYPMLDDRTAADRSRDSIKYRLWNNKNNRGAWAWYLGQPPGAKTLPAYAAPARREDVSGLPPTWMGVGELDLFHAEDCRYAERLQASDVECELYVTPKAPHAFDMLVPESAPSQGFTQDYIRFLQTRLCL
ncbi:alpha/beta hydrolase [Aestuariicella hydrocarbonica]|uniref:Alpha/beta hydrolase n=1 Tax=Pseudomaricurvus hydrocarbonicus TaxID=1470433 RepID=A0A9E5MMD2_9GAMM|nr:alpha/beta hydrolase [Aestuariicella hydrocarbonica]